MGLLHTCLGARGHQQFQVTLTQSRILKNHFQMWFSSTPLIPHHLLRLAVGCPLQLCSYLYDRDQVCSQDISQDSGLCSGHRGHRGLFCSALPTGHLIRFGGSTHWFWRYLPCVGTWAISATEELSTFRSTFPDCWQAGPVCENRMSFPLMHPWAVSTSAKHLEIEKNTGFKFEYFSW